MTDFSEYASFIWKIADLLRSVYKQSDYGKVILPFTVLRRLDAVLKERRDREAAGEEVAKINFENASGFNFDLLIRSSELADDCKTYVGGFSENIADPLEHFYLNDVIDRLDEANILLPVLQEFKKIDLSPQKVDSITMGYIFEELIRKFSELSNETAGEHFTPREVIRLMVNLLLKEDYEAFDENIIRTLYDSCAGTGGMLSVANDYLRELHPKAHLETFGQEINAQSYAICKSDMLIKDHYADHIKWGDSLAHDQHKERKFYYGISNPPFGVRWSKSAQAVKKEYEEQGFAGRFGPGLPKISDGSLLFLLHLVDKMELPKEGGGRVAIVLNGSPLFNGRAGSGESNIRKWLIEKDYLETIIALPEQLFYNTGIYTYIWLVTNRKSAQRKGKVQLVNATQRYQKMARSLGNKRHELTAAHIEDITRDYRDFQENENCKILDNADLGYARITIDRPLRLNVQVSEERLAKLTTETACTDEVLRILGTFDPKRVYPSPTAFLVELREAFKKASAKLSASLQKTILRALSERDAQAAIAVDARGKKQADSHLREYEDVPLKQDITSYFQREVLPYAPDAWIDESKTQIGYEINFTRYFYQVNPLRPLATIQEEIQNLQAFIHTQQNDTLTP